MEIKEILKNRRLELGLTMKDVSKKVGVSEATISRWESGDIENMRRDKIAALAKTLQISPSIIMGWDNFDENFDSELLVDQTKLWEEIMPVLNKQGYELQRTDDGSIDVYHEGNFFDNTDENTILSRYIAAKNKDELTADDLVYKYPENAFPIKTKKFPLIGEIACGEPILAEQHFEGYVEAGANIRADFCIRARGDSMVNIRILDGDIVFVREQPDVENGEIAAVLIDNEATLKRVNKNVPGFLQLMPENPDYEPIVINLKEPTEVRIMGKAVAFQSDIK